MLPDVAAPVTTERELRLAEIMAALSLATDLGNGFPMEKALRHTVLATGIARTAGLSGQDLSDVYYLSLLRFLGCTAFSHEMAGLVADDNAMRGLLAPVDPRPPSEVFKMIVTGLDRGAGPVRRARSVGNVLRAGQKLKATMVAADCEVAVRLATRLGMSPGVRSGLGFIFSYWDGRGLPPARGEEIPIAARVLVIAHTAEIWHRLHGPDAAVHAVRRGRGQEFDPALADMFLGNSKERLAEISTESVWDLALESEPEPRPWIPPSKLDGVAAAFADFADIKSIYTLGHSAGTANLVAGAAQMMGEQTANPETLRRAGLFHDLGRVSVSTAIWEKPGRLTAAEWERVRLHSYYTERVLSQSPALREISLLAGKHHERLDGSGYHRGIPASLLPPPARVLAAADAYQAMSEERPHRLALSMDGIAHELGQEIAAGRLDRDAVNAVLESAGQRRLKAKATWPAGLSDREVEVLRLVTRGKSNREIGKALFIAEATVHHHVLHIYGKCGVSTRAGAALYAMEHDLVQAGPVEK